MLEGSKVAVVVPAYNEARFIERTLRSIPAFVDHVVVVDDASEDFTVEAARRVPDPRVEVIRHARNLGVGAAIVTGYRRVFAAGATVAAVMAGDGQMDPRDLRALLTPVLRGEADYAKGNRLAHPDALRAMPLSRWLGNHALARITGWATGLAIMDAQCGYTALSRPASERLELERLWPGYGYPNDLLSRVAVHGLRLSEVVVRPVYGDEESGIDASTLCFTFPRVLARIAARRVRAHLWRSGFSAPTKSRRPNPGLGEGEARRGL